MTEDQALSNLQDEYDFMYDHFSAPISVTRIFVKHKFSAVGMDGVVQSRNTFYFEVHKTLNRNPVAYFSSDSYVPDTVQAHLKASRLVFPAPVRRMLRIDMFSRQMTFHTSKPSEAPSAAQVRSVFEIAGLKRKSFRVKDEGVISSSPQILPVGKPLPASKPKKFSIKKIEGEIKEKLIKPLPEDQCHRISTEELHGRNADQVVFSKAALSDVIEHIEFGEKTKKNVVEQGGIYIGKPCVLASGERLGYVEAAIAAPNTRGTSTYVEFNHDTWRYFLSTFEDRKEQGEYDADDVILGWYHTHPNSLGVFMSGTDMGTQREQFYRPWNSAIVINPHRKFIAGFYGKDATPAEVILHQK